MPNLYLNSYHPLVKNKAGVYASEQLNIPPFVDGSIRREPDFEHSTPVITCLCRGRMFTPRLRVGDVVAYITVKGKYLTRKRHQRLVCILKVDHLFETHKQAADWFTESGFPLPNNLMVPGNKAKTLAESHRGHKTKGRHTKFGCNSGRRSRTCGSDSSSSCGSSLRREWDASYRRRTRKWGDVAACSILFRDIHSTAPVITDQMLLKVFGKVPATRNPGKLDIKLLPKLLKQMGIRIQPSSL